LGLAGKLPPYRDVANFALEGKACRKISGCENRPAAEANSRMAGHLEINWLGYLRRQ
jgi:hypothetical protein